MSDLVSGEISKFKAEQGFGTITLDDGSTVPFDASHCAMKPEEGARVRVRLAKAKWGGGMKAVHVEPFAAGSGPIGPGPALPLDQQLGLLQAAHLVAGLTEDAVTRLTAALGGAPTLLALVDGYYREDATRATHDGYVRADARTTTPAELHAALAPLLTGGTLPASTATSFDDVVTELNTALATAQDGRRVYSLATSGFWRGFLVLTRDRATAVHAVLPFAAPPA